MLKEIIEILRDTFLRYKGVRTFKYQDDSLNNTQPNDKDYQVFVDDTSYHRLNITTGIFVAEFNIYILKTPSKDESILDVQDYAYALAANVIGKMDYDAHPALSVHDWSVITVSHVTDNDSAGVRLTLYLETPNPENLCEDWHWNDEPYSGDTENPIDVPDGNIGWLDVNPITLPKKPKKC